MKQLILYTSYNHGSFDEFFRINIDMALNVNTKKILYEHINAKLNNFGSELTYATPNKNGKKFNLTMDEFEFMLDRATYTHGYDLGAYDNTYLYPTCINCKIRNRCENSLQKIFFGNMIK